jgi:paraquat-inducible protein B
MGASPADEAAVQQVQYNADMSRRDAGNLMTEATANAAMFTTKAEQQLAQGMTVLAKTGNLSVDTGTAMQSGIATGPKDTTEFSSIQSDLQNQATDLNKQIADAQAKLAMASKLPTASQVEGGKGGQNGPSEYDTLQTQIKNAQSKLTDVQTKLTPMGSGGAGLQDIKNPDALLHAGGSDLLTMVSTRDQMERDKRTLFRSGENTAVSMLKAGEQYDVNAQYAKEAASWNSWQTILGAGIKIAGLAKLLL